MSEAEPRRSVRATKGQHTKSFDDLEQPAAPKRRQSKKSKKAQEQEEQSQGEDEEIIRCVCGATEQDEDSGEAWISCETCFAWQHNVCVGVSSFEDEIPDKYYCEQCRPQDHKELLEGMAKGEQPWIERRRRHEEEEPKKKRKKGRRGGKRTSDAKEEDKESVRKTKGSPEADPKDKKEAVGKGKRKSRDESHDEVKAPKHRKVSESQSRNGSPNTTAKYTPPADIAKSVSELQGTRSGCAKALKKSLLHTFGEIHKANQLKLEGDDNVDSLSERLALQIERAVSDTHPVSRGQKEYGQQIKSLTFNLKNNPEICKGLLSQRHSPVAVAVMTSEQLASAEMQKQDAEMRAKAEKQSILYTSDTGPRVRRTHKGEEIVEDESNNATDAPMPAAGGSSRRGGPRESSVKQESTGAEKIDLTARPRSQGQDADARSPSQPNFDIGKVFSSVKSPPIGGPRRPSAPALNTNGPGVDPDVDRLLEEENDSPPYSPTEETSDPDVIWRGHVSMNSVAAFNAVAKHAGGFNYSQHAPWSQLIPKRMTVAGRIAKQTAIEYLCGMRYSSNTDVVVVSLEPSTEALKEERNRFINYFQDKERYGVVSDKLDPNVKDTYLVPVPAGEGGHPEFMLNLVDNNIPEKRTEPMVLAVFVLRSHPSQIPGAAPPTGSFASPSEGRHNSVSGSGFSPATPAPPSNLSSQTPVPIPHPPGAPPPAPSHAAQPQSAPAPPMPNYENMTEAQILAAQKVGEAVGREVLGQWYTAKTVKFLIPQAYKMTRQEWVTIKSILDVDEKARDDLPHLGDVLNARSLERRNAAGGGGAVSA